MDPATLTIAITIFGVIMTSVIAITMRRIIDWFQDRRKIKENNKDAIAFTLAHKLEGKQYSEVPGVFKNTRRDNEIVQGFYDRRSGKVLDARALSSNETSDPEVVKRHKEHGLAIYT